LPLARQRLLTAKYDYYEIKGQNSADDQPSSIVRSPSSGFIYKTVPHITLKSIAQNQALDPIFAKWEPVLVEKLTALNAALAQVTPAIRVTLKAKLADKERREGKSAITDADRRRWLLSNPQSAIENPQWQEWEAPFDTDPDWPETLQAALADYRKAWCSQDG